MTLDDLAPFFGVEVLLQLKESIALGAVAGTPRPVPRFTKQGKLANARGEQATSEADIAAQQTWPIGAERDGENKAVFTYLIESAVLLLQSEEPPPLPGPPGEAPVPSGLPPLRRLVVTYRREGALIELGIDPDLILACSTVRDLKREERLIAQA